MQTAAAADGRKLQEFKKKENKTMKKIKNLLDIIAITAKIYWTKLQILAIKQLIKLL